MRCTQEQFDSIKDRLEDTFMIRAFRENFYLVRFEDGTITNGDLLNRENREIHETFNADIFLEACGVEVEKVFDYGIIQVWNGFEWCDSNNKYRLKPQPNYDNEIEALQIKAKENGMSVTINFEKI